MAVCDFCGNAIARGTGKMYVFKTGKIMYFCSSKCEKNMISLKRKPSLFKWTKSFEKGIKREKK